MEQGYDEKYGARPLKRAIQKFIEDRSRRKSSTHKSKKATCSKRISRKAEVN